MQYELCGMGWGERAYVCVQAFLLAEAAFKSGAFYLHAPVKVPENIVDEESGLPPQGEAQRIVKIPEDIKGSSRMAEALKLAKEGAPPEYAIEIPDNFGSTLVLAAMVANVSGTDQTLVDNDVFGSSSFYHDIKSALQNAPKPHRQRIFSKKAPQGIPEKLK